MVVAGTGLLVNVIFVGIILRPFSSSGNKKTGAKPVVLDRTWFCTRKGCPDLVVSFRRSARSS